jgi:hypothetical protein
VTSDLVSRLMADHRKEDTWEAGASLDRGHNGLQQGGQHQPTTRLMFCCNRIDEETPLHRAALPKMSFPKFYGENPRIWLDKCADYFQIFNIPESMYTTTTSLHLEDNATKWM